MSMTCLQFLQLRNIWNHWMSYSFQQLSPLKVVMNTKNQQEIISWKKIQIFLWIIHRIENIVFQTSTKSCQDQKTCQNNQNKKWPIFSLFCDFDWDETESIVISFTFHADCNDTRCLLCLICSGAIYCIYLIDNLGVRM